MKSLFILSVAMMFALAVAAQKNDEQEIRNLLSKQVIAWNEGKPEGFMKGYWENDSLVFIGKNGPTYGYQSTLERYKKSYPDATAMGKLTSTVVSMKRLSKDYYFVIGKWALERKAGNLSGSYTLLFQKIKGSWVIICDHSS
jgi:hypothetical protein